MEYKLSSFKFDQEINRDDKHFAIMKINELRPACPYHATFSGEFNQDKNGVKGTLRIHFPRGEFKATAKAASMKNLMKELFAQINAQIESWRNLRFDQEDTYVEFQKKFK